MLSSNDQYCLYADFHSNEISPCFYLKCAELCSYVKAF